MAAGDKPGGAGEAGAATFRRLGTRQAGFFLFLVCSNLGYDPGETMMVGLTKLGLGTALRLALGVSAAALLASCDNGPSAVHSRAAADTAAPAAGGSADSGGSDYRSSYASRSGSQYGGVDHRKDEVKLVEGKPFWSASRRYSAEESAQRAFERNGEAFGARSIDQFVKKAHAFVDHPPAGTQTLTRANGDTLFYDPKANVFAVASKDGAPRTMFKPDDGQAYWDKQKDQSSRTASRGRRSPNDDT
jgi:hypothetical protein